MPRIRAAYIDGSQAGDVFGLAGALLIGTAGGLAFTLVDLPAAWLSGSMIAVAVSALAGLRARVPALLRDVTYFLLGLSMGAGVTSDLLARIGTWPASLFGLSLTIAAVIAASHVFLRRVAGWDPASALFGSIPGALSMTLATAATSRADVVKVSLSQSMRLFMLIAVLPPLVVALETSAIVGQGSAAGPSAVTAGAAGGTDIALLVAAGLVGSALACLARVPAGILMGAFLASALLHGIDVAHGQLPAPLLGASYMVLGAVLGLRFVGVGWRLVLSTLIAGLGAFAVALAVSVAGALAVSLATGLDLGRLLIAFAPGGLEAMMILAFALNIDPAFVAVHHLFRFVAMSMLVPVIARLVLGRDWSKPPG